VKIRRALVKGTLKPPKSRHSRRDIPLSAALVSELRARAGDAEALVFASRAGTPLHYSNMRQRVLRPAVEEAGAGWAGFHTFRHTCASMLFERGANAVQVQRWIGHHSAAFTLSTYVHLLDSGVGDALELDVELAQGANGVLTRATGIDPTQLEEVFAETAD
jgi:integrase